jgi:hypothetical protein
MGLGFVGDVVNRVNGQVADKVSDAYDIASGRKAARKQEKAAKKASKKATKTVKRAQTYNKQQVAQGRTDIQQGTQQAADAMGQGYTQGRTDMGRGAYQGRRDLALGYGQAKDDLSQGFGQAREDIGATPNRLAGLLDGGLAAGFQTDPGYQFRLQQGLDAINAKASAMGGRHGGATLKALMEHGQNFASNEFQNYANRTMGLAQGADQGDQWRTGSLADLARQQGQGLAGASIGQGQGLSNIAFGTGQGLASMAQNQGQSLGNLYSGQGQNLASLGMQGSGINAGLAGNAAQAQMGAVPYAGAEDQATANTLNTLIGVGGKIGAAAAGSGG